MQHILQIQVHENRPLAELHRNFAIQMNDTHPAISVAELMRLLMDEHSMEWDTAWNVTQHTLSYTNHTLLPEALEQWPRSLFGSLLPRHLEIVDEINRRHLEDVRQKFPGDDDRAQRLSLIDENGEKIRAHGPSGRAWQPCHQRRGRAAHRAAEDPCAARLLRTDAGEILQQDQRGYAAALDGASQSRPGQAAYRAAWPRLDSRSGEAAPAGADCRTTRNFASEWRAIKLHNKVRLADYIRNGWASPSTRIPCSTCWSSACMSTSASTCRFSTS